MLTFGVEFECVAALSSEETHSDRTALEAIASSIRDQPNYQVWNVCLDVTIMEETSSSGSPREGDKGLQLFGTEIVSLIFEAEGDWLVTVEEVSGSSGLKEHIFPSQRTNQPVFTYMSV